MIERKKINSLLDILRKSMAIAESNLENPDEYRRCVETILSIQQKVNSELFFTNQFSRHCFSPIEVEVAIKSGTALFERILSWYTLVCDVMENYPKEETYLDSEFYCLFRYIKESDVNSLASDMKSNFCEQDDQYKEAIIDFYKHYKHLWGYLSPKDEIYDVIDDRANLLKSNMDDFIYLYNRLADYRSKTALCRIIRNWITYDKDDLKFMKEMCFSDYFDLDIVTPHGHDVWVDCGAYKGDSAMGFVEAYKQYDRIYCYEASNRCFEVLKENIVDYENVVLKNFAVGDEYKTIYISDDEDGSSIFGEANQEVEMVTIDGDIDDEITMIKMDIEGAEQSALKGARNHIIKDYPTLLICVYHGNHDIIEIPKLIDSIRDDYDFYIRYNGNFIAPTEIVLFAKPR